MKLSAAIVGLVIVACSCFAAGKDLPVEKMKNYQKYEDILLDSSDIPNVSKVKVRPREWIIRMRSEGEWPLSEEGFEQVIEFEDNSLMILIHYARFADTLIAEEALSFFFEHCAEPFQLSEPWPNAHLTNEPDQSWFSYNRHSNGIIFRSGTTCVLVFAIKGSHIEERKQILYFSDKVIERLQAEENRASKDSAPKPNEE